MTGAEKAVALIPCPDCDGEGRAYYEVGRCWDGSPEERLLTCETCNGTGEVEMLCPECQQPCGELVESDYSPEVKWCVSCALDALENGDGYTEEQAAQIRAKAAA